MKATIDVLSHYFSKEKITLVDIGALGGTKAPWTNVRPMLRIVGFEPQDAVTETIRNENGDLQGGVAIGSEEGSATLYITQKADNSSLAMPNHAFTQRLAVSDRYVVTKQEAVNTMSLDSWLKKESISSVDFLKIDTQGTEGDVLKGAQHTLSSVLGLDIEVNFAKRYIGQTYFSDIDAILRDAGFVLFDLQRRYFKYANGTHLGGPKGQLTHGTALYFRSIESLNDVLERSDARRNFAAFLSIVMLYGYYDYALEALNTYGDLLPIEERALLEKEINSQLSWNQRLPRLSIRFRIARLFDAMSWIIKQRSRLGTFGDDSIGNVS